MSVFQHLDYRKYLMELLEERRTHVPGFTQAKLAESCGIRNTYLSNVLKGRGNFNSDQIHALAKHLGLGPLESRYLFLMKELDQSLSPARKAELSDEMAGVRQKAEKTEHRIQAKVRDDDPALVMKYYGDPYIKIVHVFLQIPRYAKNPPLIAKDLNIQMDYLERLVDVLIELEVVRYNEKSIEVLKRNYHLPKESPMLLPHQALLRMKSAERLLQIAIDRRYSFSVTFSSTEEVRAYVQDQFMEFLKRIEKKVKESEGENPYQINFDLFPWNQE